MKHIYETYEFKPNNFIVKIEIFQFERPKIDDFILKKNIQLRKFYYKNMNLLLHRNDRQL